MIVSAALPANRVGRDRPRLAPPTPAKHRSAPVIDEAAALGLPLWPWQRRALRYLTAITADGRHLYPDVCVVVARQNGKTTLTMPLITRALRDGQSVMHVAQTRVLPQEMFDVIATALSNEPDLFPRRRGRIIWPRYGSGQEVIKLANGGMYRIAAAHTGAARGFSTDLVIVDELREMTSADFLDSVRPTLAASDDPQIVYLSNAGTDESVVLNELRDRAADDPALAYLEWSAAPDRRTDDPAGWLEANPAIGHKPGLWTFLERTYTSYHLSGRIGSFETEHLCRWVHTVLPPIIRVETWEELRVDDGDDPPRRPSFGVAVDPSGRRASAVAAWLRDDGRVAVRMIADERGDPVDVGAFADALRGMAREMRVRNVAYDSATDAEVAKYFKRAEAITGAKLTNASSRFVNLVDGHGIRWDGPPITDDIEWTGRKTHPVPGTWTAVTLSDDHPVTGMLATIRAVWLASGPRPSHGRLG